MSETLEQQREEDAAVETQTQLPADTTPAPSNTVDSELDDLLREFNEKTRQQEPEPATDATGQVTEDELNSFLSGLDSDRKKITELEGTISNLRFAEFQRQEMAAFDDFADKLQNRLPSHIPPGFAKDALMSMAHDQTKALAWQYRNVDRQAVDAELRRVETAFAMLERNPSLADPNKVAQLRDYGTRLGIAYNAQQIIRNAERDIIKRAEAHKVYDEIATADHDAVAFAVREAHAGDIPTPPPNFGRMTDKEFKEYTRIHYGF